LKKRGKKRSQKTHVRKKARKVCSVRTKTSQLATRCCLLVRENRDTEIDSVELTGG
jgi:hypothetical protein